MVHINFFVPHVFCENGPPPVSTFLWALMFTRHLCMYSLGPWSDSRGKPLPKGLASYCKAETTFTFYFSILTLSSAFLSINNIEMKSESGFSFAMASQPFRFGSYIFNKIFFKYAEILNIQICCLLLDQIFQ